MLVTSTGPTALDLVLWALVKSVVRPLRRAPDQPGSRTTRTWREAAARGLVSNSVAGGTRAVEVVPVVIVRDVPTI